MAEQDLTNRSNPAAVDRKQGRRHGSKDFEVNMTAMVDVLFMLIIFFLVGGRFVRNEGTLANPMPEVGVGGPPVATLQVGLQEDSPNQVSVTLDGRPVTMAAFYRELKDRQRQFPASSDQQVRISPAGNVSWNWVLPVYHDLRRAGYKNLSWSLN